MPTTFVMVWGTASGAGKSWVTTALCRWAARQGLRVAPFKAQNMSNNARVVSTPGGMGEIGAAQYFQALAAGVTPSVYMNPILLKPESDTGSQVIVAGQVRRDLSAMPWRTRSPILAAAAHASLRVLSEQYDLIIMEGAGSPAETNLAAQDYVNLHSVRWAQALGTCRSVLVTDIDRGGAFAHLYGTWSLIPADVRTTLAGFVLNKFRGDPSLLAPAPADLEALTGVPTLAVLPMIFQHGLPEEDGIYQTAHPQKGMSAASKIIKIAVIAYPHISNIDEFSALALHPNVQLVWAREVSDLADAAYIVLPGSKQVSGDLQWLKRAGLALAIQQVAQAGTPILGICGGLQMLGETLHDPAGFDGQTTHTQPEQTGLALLPVRTEYGAQKVLAQRTMQLSNLHGVWARLNELTYTGYEIHCGLTETRGEQVAIVAKNTEGQPIAWQGVDGYANVLGTYSHGLLEATDIQTALFGLADSCYGLDAVFDRLADCVEQAFSNQTLNTLIG